MTEKIVVVGGGGHAKVIISILKKIHSYEIVGYTDLYDNGALLGIPYLGNDNQLQTIFNNGVHRAAIGLGQINSSQHRNKLVSLLNQIGFHIPPLISPHAIINEEVSIGEGTVVMDGAVINSGTTIGDYCIINTRSSIDHDSFIGNYTHIAPGATLSGGVKLGENILIGTGANIIQNISVADNVLISAGSSVQKDIAHPGIYRGVPAKLIVES